MRNPFPLNLYRKVPRDQILVPVTGTRVIRDNWWFVTQDDHVLFYGAHWRSPQCNPDRRLLEMLPIQDTRHELIPLAYVPVEE